MVDWSVGRSTDLSDWPRPAFLVNHSRDSFSCRATPLPRRGAQSINVFVAAKDWWSKPAKLHVSRDHGYSGPPDEFHGTLGTRIEAFQMATSGGP